MKQVISPLVPSSRAPSHPREILADGFGIPPFLIRHLPDVTPEIAKELATYFHTTPQFWLNLQANFDASKARRQ